MERLQRQLRLVPQMQAGNAVMINLCRLYCYRQGVFKLVDVPITEAKKTQRELTLEDWVVTHTEHV